MVSFYEKQNPNYFGNVKTAALPEKFENFGTQKKALEKAFNNFPSHTMTVYDGWLWFSWAIFLTQVMISNKGINPVQCVHVSLL